MSIKDEIKKQAEDEAVQSPPCPNKHEDMYLTWRHQGDGTNYFICESCRWIKFDYESGNLKQALLDRHNKSLENAAMVWDTMPHHQLDNYQAAKAIRTLKEK